MVWGPAVGALAGLCTVVGHCYPVLHRFRGGKGVATAGGMALALAPTVMIVMVVMYGSGLALTRISAVGSLAAAAVAVPALLLTGVDTWTVVWFGATMLLIVFRHRSNLLRLRAGTEHKLTS